MHRTIELLLVDSVKGDMCSFCGKDIARGETFGAFNFAVFGNEFAFFDKMCQMHFDMFGIDEGDVGFSFGGE